MTRAGLIVLAIAMVGLQGCGSSTDVVLTEASPTPSLRFSPNELDDAVFCSADVAPTARAPVLLVHATTVNSDLNYGWNYIPALRAMGWPYCTVELPNQAMSDIQESAEFVVHAIRVAHERSGQRIQILGHSQGGHVVRWALRWWPDTRPMVEELVSFAAPNHGSDIVEALCLVGGCAPAIWQQRSAANYYRALNCGVETFDDIDYTSLYSKLDEFVQPNLDDSGTSSLRGGANVANIALQDICPLDVSEHLAIGTYSAVGYALAFDALTHAGPADAARIDRGVCAQLLMPGVDPSTFATDFARAGSAVVSQLALYPHVEVEPALKEYVPQSCR